MIDGKVPQQSLNDDLEWHVDVICVELTLYLGARHPKRATKRTEKTILSKPSCPAPRVAPSVAIPNHPALTTMVNDVSTLVRFSAFAIFKAATAPLMETAGFLPYLRTHSPLTVVGFMLPSERIALELAHQMAPPILQVVSDVLFLVTILVPGAAFLYPAYEGTLWKWPPS